MISQRKFIELKGIKISERILISPRKNRHSVYTQSKIFYVSVLASENTKKESKAEAVKSTS